MENPFSRQRKELILKNRKEILDIAKTYQTALINAIRDRYLDTLEINGNKIVFNAKNMSSLANLTRILNEVANLEGDNLLDWFINQIDQSSDLSNKYFSHFMEDTKAAYKTAYDKILLRYGIINGKFIVGSLLYDISRINDPIRRIKSEVVKAISLGISYGQFMKNMANFVSNKTKSGLIENHLRTNVYDTFAQVDRQMNHDMATHLDLNYAYYSDGLLTTSRQFCIDRVGKVFHRSQIESWKKLDWQGKPAANYDPFTDVGGPNCIHTLDWITDDLAKVYLQG